MLSPKHYAKIIADDWKNMSPAARPYVRAMLGLDDIADKYMLDTGSSVVAYFLANAASWRGPVARETKKALNEMLAEHLKTTKEVNCLLDIVAVVSGEVSPALGALIEKWGENGYDAKYMRSRMQEAIKLLDAHIGDASEQNK